MSRAKLDDLTRQLLSKLDAASCRISVAESCTGGMIAASIIRHAGASKNFIAGFVTYANDAKVKLLDVSQESLTQYGAVSCQVAKQMAQGAMTKTGSDIAVSVTGIAGPAGGTAQKPVGLVWIGLASKNKPVLVRRKIFLDKDRTIIRSQASKHAVIVALEQLGS